MLGIPIYLIFAGVFSLLRGDSLGGVWYILVGWFIKEASAASGSVAEAAREHFMRTGYGSYPVTRGDARLWSCTRTGWWAC